MRVTKTEKSGTSLSVVADTEAICADSLRVVGYTRVSTGKQEDSGAGLAAQEAAIRAEVKRRGWDLQAIVTDIGSGKAMTSRVALNAALAGLDAGKVDMLLVSKLDRVSRSVADFANLLDRSVRKGWSLSMLDISVDTTTPNGKMVAGMMSVIAQWEREIIGARTKDALRARKAEGVHCGRKSVLDPNTRAYIVELRDEGLSFAAIARRLMAEQVPTALGGTHWERSTVRDVTKSVELEQELAEVRVQQAS
jgi:DNA invertase Pin-like site-specific DNA recombinase